MNIFQKSRNKRIGSLIYLRLSQKNLCPMDIGSRVVITTENEQIVLQYIPVSSFLREFADKAGNYLHVPKRPFTNAEWKKLRGDVRKAIKSLEKNLTGNLLGPLLVKGKNISMNMELIKDDHALHAFSEKISNGNPTIKIEVSYFKVD